MVFSIYDPVKSPSSPAPARRSVGPVPRLVILHPLPLYAEAIRAVIRRDSRWEVVGMTADIDAAVTLSADADAVVFDTRWGSVAEVPILAHRLRQGRPDLPLVLLTRHDGIAFLDATADADLDVIVHMRDTAATVRSALAAVELGRPFRSPLLETCRKRTRGRRRAAAPCAPDPQCEGLAGHGGSVGMRRIAAG